MRMKKFKVKNSPLSKKAFRIVGKAFLLRGCQRNTIGNFKKFLIVALLLMCFKGKYLHLFYKIKENGLQKIFKSK